MGETSEQENAMIDSFIIFMAFLAHFLPEIPTKHNIKETASKSNNWGPFYISNGEVPGGG